MTFDNTYKPNRDGLSPEIAALMDRAFYSRREKGFNVQFVNELGHKDEWSFNSRDRAEAFAANLARNGTESVFSA
ncbi:hypothetical protein EHH54_39005 [Rhizobium leguminosarum]|uniref:hypothetical protein n=1 Tax=Rhizobium leguminosarum TaxID=384 RepID=UPI000FEC5328|nr:hypothetical protein [Rhizobium leguminosarum]RWX22598.1 hypothetical protein EHH54_39005 [Rhizobium leguminosarum]